MPRVSPPPKPARRPPPRTPAARTLGEPRDVKDRPRGWMLALRRQRRRLRPTLYGLAALGLLVAVGSVMHASSHAASLTSLRQRFGAAGDIFGLRVRSVIVEGRVTTPAPLVDAAIGAASGDALLGFSVAEARARILGIDTVEDATVERRWPATILVSLTERHAFAVWQNQHRFVLIDRAGLVLADQKMERDVALPLVVGPGAPAHAAELLDLLATHPEIRTHMVAAVRVSDRRWNLRMTSGADVMLPADDQAAALDRLAALQAGHRLLDRRLASVDLRLADRTTLRPDAALPPADVPAATAGTATGTFTGIPAARAPAGNTDAAPAALSPVPHSPRQPT